MEVPSNYEVETSSKGWKPGFDIYDFSQNTLDRPLDELFVKGATIQALIRCSGIWIVGGKFGCSWNVSPGDGRCSGNNPELRIYR